MLDNHDQLARQTVEKHRGKLIKTTGDGILATFDGPARAIKCAISFGAAAKQIGLPARAGLHTGEVEARGTDIGGIAVHAAARVMAQSRPGEVLVSRVVSDLVAGAGLKFTDRGSYELKGLPERWDVCRIGLERGTPVSGPLPRHQIFGSAPNERSLQAERADGYIKYAGNVRSGCLLVEPDHF